MWPGLNKWPNKNLLLEFCSVVEKRSKELKPCKFPFKFDGKTYEKCTLENDPANKLWCSTNVDENGDHIRSGGYWGHCAQNCMTNLLQKNAEVYIPTNGNFSSFLYFMYQLILTELNTILVWIMTISHWFL